jgi:hypothetical protein
MGSLSARREGANEHQEGFLRGGRPLFVGASKPEPKRGTLEGSF